MKIQAEKPFRFHRNLGPINANKGSAQILKRTSSVTRSVIIFFNTISQSVVSIIQKGIPIPQKIAADLHQKFYSLFETAGAYGISINMDDYEKRKLRIFNRVNFFQFLTGLITPLTVLIGSQHLSFVGSITVILPPFVSLAVLYLNFIYKNNAALLVYFILYPFCSSLAYINGINLGVELFFVLYGILSVFFLRQISHMIFCIAFSMVNYFMLAVVLKKYQYYLETHYVVLYLFNHLLALGFIFYGLYLIKKENAGYQHGILSKNNELQLMNDEITKQKEEIAENARRLREQKEKLDELNKLKTRLFSIVSHDLKAPIYAVRNLFLEIQQYNMSATDVNKLIPHVIKDLNYTTGLMENLLHWAKSQMNSGSIHPQALDINEIVKDIIQQQRLQAENKKVSIENQVTNQLAGFADKDMISLVIRNLLSNAIKFTPQKGKVCIGSSDGDSFIEIFVSDTGKGISQEALEKIRESNFYSTTGTESESGTGLGLMLCKEFLEKNGGQLHIESKEGKGSVFSFTIPKPGH